MIAAEPRFNAVEVNSRMTFGTALRAPRHNRTSHAVFNHVAPAWAYVASDPLGYEAGDANLQRYVGNSPTNFTDPLGLERQGHHWVPQSVYEALAKNGLLSQEAYEVFRTGTKDPFLYDHAFDTWNKISHDDYNKNVKNALEAWIDYLDSKGLKGPLSGDDAARFLDWIVRADCGSVTFLRSEIAKSRGVATAFDDIFKWRRGFLQSIIAARAAEEAAAKAGKRLSKEELKAIAQLVVNGESDRPLTSKYAKNLVTAIANKSEEMKPFLRSAARWGVPILSFVFIAGAAGNGYAEDGLFGAYRAGCREAFMADMVEGLTSDAADLVAEGLTGHADLIEAGDAHARKRFGGLEGDPNLPELDR